ncbi:MAG: putative toxin-antitoxin system toxin component, PIN family [Scytonema sp. PMC 1069.18]|nr:putative toxin-antitoxin system toxin component, PIN family [Scytonema sp. PMC 1069.18]MEC4881373.1 putative toxin-antitoxin system toxin component, PIN family [Scytonema sp. PMC 1070.18]
MYVFDSCVLVAALRSRRGASFLILRAIRQRVIAGFLSEALFLEYADVLKRDQNLQQFWTTPEEIDVVLGVLADVLKPVPIYFQWRPQLRDPNDEMVLECAINAQASAIITFNEQDFLPAAQQFGIEVIQPGVLVRKLYLRERFSQ